MNTFKFNIVLALLITIGILGCKSYKETTAITYDSTGLIMGLDKAQCVCCGNWIIQIEGEQKTHQFLELPANSTIDLNEAAFPLSVRLNWTESTSGCKFAIISEIKVN